LRWLDLQRTKVTDASVRELIEHHQELELQYISGPGITEAATRDLKRALPLR
jgi:hypothetical protein